LKFNKIPCHWLLVASVIALAGCGEDSDLPRVSGTVSVDGQPVEKGSISFIPVDGQGPTTGAEIVTGKYASTAPRGESKVEIRVPKVVGQKKLYDTPDSPVQNILAEVLPDKYNEKTELRVQCQPGRNEKSWELKTK